MRPMHFDNHQFQTPKAPWKYGAQTGLEYVDFAFHGMHVQHKPQASKHYRAPIWAMDDGELKLLVARFLENRAGIEPIDASIPDRITRAEEELKSRRPQMFERLDRLSHRYVELKRAGGNQKLIRKLEIQIQVVDTQLVILDKSPAAMVTAIVYLYWRAHADSVGVGLQLGLTPWMVRTTLTRLKHLWEKFQQPDYVPFARSWGHLERACIYNLNVAPGRVFGRLTVVHSTNDDLVPVEVVCRMEPRSLVRQKSERKIFEGWVNDKILLHTRWQSAFIHKNDLPHPPKRSVWRCLCVCGRSIEATSNMLRRGVARSCGCDKQKG
jgi:hypothetical protein